MFSFYKKLSDIPNPKKGESSKDEYEYLYFFNTDYYYNDFEEKLPENKIKDLEHEIEIYKLKLQLSEEKLQINKESYEKEKNLVQNINTILKCELDFYKEYLFKNPK